MEYKKCDIEGCSRIAVFGEGSKMWCSYHCELFDRGTEFAKATPVVSSLAGWKRLQEIEAVLTRIERSALSSDVAKGVSEVIDLCNGVGFDPCEIARREIVNGIGEKVLEPGQVYANRVSKYLKRFIVDRACEKVGLPASGKTVVVRKEVQ